MTLPVLAAVIATVSLVLVVGPDELILLVVELTVVVVLFSFTMRAPAMPRRIAVLGSPAAAEALAADLGRRGAHPVMVGRIAPMAPPVLDRYWLGPLSQVRTLVEHHDIDLLLLAGGVPRMEVFNELERSCADVPVRMCELSMFYESQFGQVPIAEINSAWLQYVMHPRYATRRAPSKRALDLVVSAAAGALAFPVVLTLALLVRRDGGPAFFRQVRVGEGGRTFTMLKLRTMRPIQGDAAPWTLPDDDRITPLGAWLRRTHLDELPQLLNVLRGEMTLVGPRPEQPHYVQELERLIPFYSRRHLLQPGLTGWAQVRCGYGGSELGTAWKLSHDLYYLKHRRLRLDIEILLRTLVMPFSEDQFADPERRPLVFGEIAAELVPEVPAGMGQELSPAASASSS